MYINTYLIQLTSIQYFMYARHKNNKEYSGLKIYLSFKSTDYCERDNRCPHITIVMDAKFKVTETAE